MLRKFAYAALVILLLAGGSFGAEWRGRFKTADPNADTLTFTSGGRDVVLKVAPNAVLIDEVNAKSALNLSSLQPNANLIITAEGMGSDQVITRIRITK
jgi:hypothetical protein